KTKQRRKRNEIIILNGKNTDPLSLSLNCTQLSSLDRVMASNHTLPESSSKKLKFLGCFAPLGTRNDDFIVFIVRSVTSEAIQPFFFLGRSSTLVILTLTSFLIRFLSPRSLGEVNMKT